MVNLILFLLSFPSLLVPHVPTWGTRERELYILRALQNLTFLLPGIPAAYAIAIRRIECGDIELQDILLDFTRDRDDGVGEGDRAARKRGMDTETGDDCDDNTDYF